MACGKIHHLRFPEVLFSSRVSRRNGLAAQVETDCPASIPTAVEGFFLQTKRVRVPPWSSLILVVRRER